MSLFRVWRQNKSSFLTDRRHGMTLCNQGSSVENSTLSRKVTYPLSKYCQRNAREAQARKLIFCEFLCLIISPLYDTRVVSLWLQEVPSDNLLIHMLQLVWILKNKNSREQLAKAQNSRLHVSSLIANSMIQLRFVITFSAIALWILRRLKLDDKIWMSFGWWFSWSKLHEISIGTTLAVTSIIISLTIFMGSMLCAKDNCEQIHFCHTFSISQMDRRKDWCTDISNRALQFLINFFKKVPWWSKLKVRVFENVVIHVRLLPWCG